VSGILEGLLSRPLRVLNVGVDLFADEVAAQGVEVRATDWRPPVPGTEDALAALALRSIQIAEANDLALGRMQNAHPHLAGVGTARELLDLDDGTFLHAGPPVEWGDMSGPLRGAIIGAAIHEGLAGHPEEAAELAGAGRIRFAPCHDRSAVGPMAGVISASMPVWIVEDASTGRRAHSTFNEGLGKVLRYGAFDTEVQERLRWIRDVLAPVASDALRRLAGPVDLRSLIAQALHMGDEGHNRNRACTSLLLRALLPGLLESGHPTHWAVEVARFIDGNDHFALNLTMAAAKVSADAAAGIRSSSIVTAMARNGTEFGVRVSGTSERWFTGPAGKVEGLYLPGYRPEDANPDIGDSTITETAGIGAFAMAAAPAIVGFVGGDPADALRATSRMYEITWGESSHYTVPALGFRGTPVGIDVRAVARTRILPTINTGIAHREPGIGQIGAGLVEPPVEAFAGAVRTLAETIAR
jgi:hypothetical protein